MAAHPPEHHIRQGEKAAKQADPHGIGHQRTQEERGRHEPAAQTTPDRHQTETAAAADKGD